MKSYNIGKLFFSIFIIVILAIVNASFALAVGVSAYDLTPEVDFMPGTVKRFPFQVKTTVRVPMDYKLSILDGPLKEFARSDPPVLENVMPGSNPWFDVVLDFQNDENLEPGLHELRFSVMEGTSAGKKGNTARTGITVPIKVRVLSENKWAKGSVSVPNVNQNDNLKINSKVISWSKQDIDQAYMKMDLLAPSGEVVKTMETDKFALPAAKTKDFVTVVTTTKGLIPGIYTVSSTMYYDGETEKIEEQFRIGEYAIDIINMTKQAPPGGIRKLDAVFSSRWNNVISSAYYELNFDINNTDLYAKSESFDFGPMETKKSPIFIDLTNVKEGKYQGVLTLHYGDKKTEKQVELTVSKKKVLEQVPMMYIIGSVVVLIVILLVLANIYFFMKSKKQKEERQ